jgi:predicted lipoprotein with Yx(FWY)xxD motif
MRVAIWARLQMTGGAAQPRHRQGPRSARRQRGPARAFVLAAIVGTGVAGGTAYAATPGHQAAGGVVVSTRAVHGLGTVLVNSSGRTLYFNTEEVSGKILCTGACLGFWFPATTSSSAAPKPTVNLPGKLSTIRRPGTNQFQLAYQGKALYTFRFDGSAGQAKGNDFTDHFGAMTFHWRAVVTTGTRGSKTPPTTTPANGGGTGYNYSS